MRYIIYRLNEDGPAAEGFLVYEDRGWDIPALLAAGRAERDPAATLEELADLCDRSAANRNNHAFVGAHRILAAILHQQAGRETATRVMRAVAEYGGLDYASGCGVGDDASRAAWGDLGLPEPWEEWTLP